MRDITNVAMTHVMLTTVQSNLMLSIRHSDSVVDEEPDSSSFKITTDFIINNGGF